MKKFFPFSLKNPDNEGPPVLAGAAAAAAAVAAAAGTGVGAAGFSCGVGAAGFGGAGGVAADTGVLFFGSTAGGGAVPKALGVRASAVESLFP